MEGVSRDVRGSGTHLPPSSSSSLCSSTRHTSRPSSPVPPEGGAGGAGGGVCGGARPLDRHGGLLLPLEAAGEDHAVEQEEQVEVVLVVTVHWRWSAHAQTCLTLPATGPT